jgi:hypothetical protein
MNRPIDFTEFLNLHVEFSDVACAHPVITYPQALGPTKVLLSPNSGTKLS